MKSIPTSGLILMISLFLLFACAPVYQLQSGKYQMSVKTGSEAENVTVKTVELTVEKGLVTIRNPDSSEILSGRLEGGRLIVSSREADQMVEFNGVLSADNRVKGEAVQKKGEEVIYNAGFELVPTN